MLRILLGVLIGAAATASYLQRSTSAGLRQRPIGRVDELSTAGHNVVADPAVNAGDGTPAQGTSEDRSPAVTP
jgi:hypothetical protein